MLDPLYHLAADAIVFFHRGFGPIFGDDSFFSWALSVMLLVVCVRILIFPLFVKQVKSQRTMQMMQPLIKEIKEKYGHDKPRMQQEMMALQKEHGNPLLGCLPILLQIPLFFALFSVFNKLKPMEIDGVLQWRPRVGLSAEQIEQIAEAKLWGISLSTSFTSPQDFLDFIVADGLNVKIAAVILIVLMGATTFFTQKQIMARTGPVDPQQAMIQKVLLYGSPIALAVFGFNFPIAVLLYWLTTNLWSMGQQFFVIKKMPPLQPIGKKSPAARPDGDVAVSKPKVGVKPQRDAKRQPGGKPAGGRPAGGSQPNLSKAAGTGGGGTKSAPRGTRSPSGAAASGSAKKGGSGSAPGSANASPKRSKPAGTPADPTTSPSSGSANGVKPAAAADNDSVASSNGSSAADLTSRDSDAAQGSPAASKDASPRTAGTSPVGANARRQPSGSRPARKKNRGKRPGGRH